MKAEIKAKIENRQRVSLEQVIPLKVPFSIQIDIADACNMKCNFCFHSDEEAIRKYNVHFGIMKWEVYKKIIDDIKKDWVDVYDEKVKKLRLFAQGEPLLNRNVLRMIKYATELKVAEVIEITTNGTLLSHEFCNGVAESGLGILNISMNGINGEQYRKNCGYNIEWDRFVGSIKELNEKKGNCKVYIKLSDVGYSKSDKERFFDIFGDICDQIYIEGISANLWADTKVNQVIADNERGLYGKKYDRKMVCTTIFTTMVINSAGLVKLCCVDWKNSVIIGDTNKQTIREIWEGQTLRNIQVAFLKGNRDNMEMCSKCDQPEVTSPDNIDQHMNVILERYEQM